MACQPKERSWHMLMSQELYPYILICNRLHRSMEEPLGYISWLCAFLLISMWLLWLSFSSAAAAWACILMRRPSQAEGPLCADVLLRGRQALLCCRCRKWSVHPIRVLRCHHDLRYDAAVVRSCPDCGMPPSKPSLDFLQLHCPSVHASSATASAAPAAMDAADKPLL